MVNITLPLLLTVRVCLDIIRHLSIYYDISECICRITCTEVAHISYWHACSYTGQ